jgi:hypothetical protein
MVELLGWNERILRSVSSDSEDAKIALALAALRSHRRHRREADHWLQMYEQRSAALCDGDREKIRLQTDLRPTGGSQGGFRTEIDNWNDGRFRVRTESLVSA